VSIRGKAGDVLGDQTAVGGSVSHSVSPRQNQVLEGIAAGLSDKQIALKLGVSHRTVRAHIDKLFQKYGVRCRAGLVVSWLRVAGSGLPAFPEIPLIGGPGSSVLSD